MAISRLPGQDATGTSSTTSVTATYPGATTANNLLIAVCGDNDGNTGTQTLAGWTEAISFQQSSGTDCHIFFKIAAGSETSVTVSNANAASMRLAIYEYTGNVTASTLDKTAGSGSNLGATTCPTGTTATTTVADELCIVGALVGGVAASSPSWNNSFNARDTVASGLINLFTADRIVSATGAYTTTVTYTGASSGATGVIATFKAAASQANGFVVALV